MTTSHEENQVLMWPPYILRSRLFYDHFLCRKLGVIMTTSHEKNQVQLCNVVPRVILGVPSNLMDRSNHLILMQGVFMNSLYFENQVLNDHVQSTVFLYEVNMPCNHLAH